MYPVKSTRMFFGTSAERTAAGLASFLPGDEYYETDTSDTYQHNGTAWTQKNTGGGGTPGGSSGQVQYNDGGAFGGFGKWDSAANQLLIGGATAADGTAVFEAHDSIANVRFNVVNDSASNGSNVANIGFYLRNDAETFMPFAFWTAGSVDLTDGSEDSYATIATIRNGAVNNVFYFGPNEIYLNYNSDDIDTIIYGANDLFTARVDAGDNAFQVGIVTPGNIADFRSSGVVFNSGEADRDFRIAGNGVTNGVFYDAGINTLGINTGSPNPAYKLHVVSTAANSLFERSSSSAAGVNVLYNPDSTDGNAAVLSFATDTTGGGATSQKAGVQLWGIVNTHDDATYATTFQVRTRVSGAIGARVAVAAGTTFGAPSGGDPGIGAISLDAHINFDEMSSTPSSPTAGTMCNVYMKADKLVIQYNDGGTVRYKYLSLTGTGVTWQHSTTAP